LLDAARDLFARQDYRSTTTKEIAQAAQTTEQLLFRHFGSKALLFREALVRPFTGFVDDFAITWQAATPEQIDDDDTLAQLFVGRLYDMFVEHKGLLMTLMTSETMSEEELADTGISEISAALGVLGQIGAEAMRLRGVPTGEADLPAYSTVAMIAGMAALRPTFFLADQPSRDALVEELIRATLHGFLHRPN
jgi:AcrR family transcriptional regulator